MPIIGEGTWRYDFQRDWASLPRWWNFGETTPQGWPQNLRAGRGGGKRRRLRAVPRGASGAGVRCRRQVHLILGRGEVFRIRARPVDRPARQDLDRRCRPAHGHPARAGRQAVANTGHSRTLAARNVSTVSRSICRPARRSPRTAISSCRTATAIGGCIASARTATLKHSWGEHGTGPGQFVLVHFIARRPEGPALRVRPGQSPDPDCFPRRARRWPCGLDLTCRATSRSGRK